MFLLVPAYPGCPGSKAVKRSLLLLLLYMNNTKYENLCNDWYHSCIGQLHKSHWTPPHCQSFTREVAASHLVSPSRLQVAHQSYILEVSDIHLCDWRHSLPSITCSMQQTHMITMWHCHNRLVLYYSGSLPLTKQGIRNSIYPVPKMTETLLHSFKHTLHTRCAYIHQGASQSCSALITSKLPEEYHASEFGLLRTIQSVSCIK